MTSFIPVFHEGLIVTKGESNSQDLERARPRSLSAIVRSTRNEIGDEPSPSRGGETHLQGLARSLSRKAAIKRRAASRLEKTTPKVFPWLSWNLASTKRCPGTRVLTSSQKASKAGLGSFLGKPRANTLLPNSADPG